MHGQKNIKLFYTVVDLTYKSPIVNTLVVITSLNSNEVS